MDDLTRIKGIGAATAKKLNEAGITNFVDLALANHMDEPLASIAKSDIEAVAWITAATELANVPPQDNQGSTNIPPESNGQSGGGNPAIPAGKTQKDETLKFSSASFVEDLPQLESGLALITVIGPSKGLRRAGHLFGSTPSTIRVTMDELKLIEADPGLSVTPGDASKEVSIDSKPATRLTLDECLDGKGRVRPIRVLGPKSGRRRGGEAFGATAVTLTPSKEALEQILGDTELSVALA